MPAPDRLVESRLRERHIRFTPGRRRVVEALSAADGPRSAADLHAEIRAEIPLSSLYRSLAVLEQAGVVAPHFSAKGVTRYELAEWLSGHHHHLVCVGCGSVEDIDVPPDTERALRAIVDEIGDRSRFVPSDHALEIAGRCAGCA